jgi:hypothetical protein
MYVNAERGHALPCAKIDVDPYPLITSWVTYLPLSFLKSNKIIHPIQ